MDIVVKSEGLKRLVKGFKLDNKTIGFVPTMGALHAGHLSLVRRAKASCDVVIVSVFVNPNQFNNVEDLSNYPQDIDKDIQMLRDTNCHILFNPTKDEVYPEVDNRQFDFGILDKVMEGEFRSGHFNGVAQVVSRFFEMVQPDKAFFGQKDFQQLVIIRKMNEMLNCNVDIISCPIVREMSGLALSSRNARLSKVLLNESALISRTLFESKLQMSTKNIKEVINFVVDRINNSDLLRVEYFNIVDGYTLQAIDDWETSNYIVGCIAVFADKVRLIDNLIYKENHDAC